MISVGRLGYIGWNVKDLSAWDDLLCTVYGLELRSDNPQGERHYRVDNRYQRLSLYQTDEDDVRFIGWEVDNHEELIAIKEHLILCGVDVKQGTRAQIKERKVMDLVCLKDPDNFNLEIFFAGLEEGVPFNLSREGLVFSQAR